MLGIIATLVSLAAASPNQGTPGNLCGKNTTYRDGKCWDWLPEWDRPVSLSWQHRCIFKTAHFDYICDLNNIPKPRKQKLKSQ